MHFRYHTGQVNPGHLVSLQCENPMSITVTTEDVAGNNERSSSKIWIIGMVRHLS